MPYCNSHQTIQKTLDSVVKSLEFAQVLFEIIIIDDFSDEDSSAYLAELVRTGKLNVKILKNSSRKGPSYSRNLGTLCSSAPLICFFDSDDICGLEKFLNQISVINSADHSICLVYSDWELVSNTESFHRTPGVHFNRDSASDEDIAATVLDLVLDENFIATGSQIFRKSWLKRVGGFDEKRRLIEDVLLMLNLAVAGGKFLKAEFKGKNFSYIKKSSGLSSGKTTEFCLASLDNLLFSIKNVQSIGEKYIVKLLSNIENNCFSICRCGFSFSTIFGCRNLIKLAGKKVPWRFLPFRFKYFDPFYYLFLNSFRHRIIRMLKKDA